MPAVPPAAGLDRPLAGVEQVLRTALLGPAEPDIDVGLEILDPDVGQSDRQADRSTSRHRYGGRHERGAARKRQGGRGRYRRAVLLADTAAAAAVGAVGAALWPEGEAPLLALFLPPVLVVSLGLNGAYEGRVLFAGLAEYGRVVRAGVVLVTAAVLAALLPPVALPRSYVLALLLAATVAAVSGRILIRRSRTSRLS